MKKEKAVALFSGGLDSMLAIKLIQEQGIEVVALHFLSPFFGSKEKIQKKAQQLSALIEIIDFSKDHIKMLRNPKHGFGKAANPCIDCHALMLKKAKEYAKKIGADFIITGEVLGERPFSQNRKALEIVEKEAGVTGTLVRPLSAKLLPETIPEKKGWVDREKLLGISGRRRLEQFQLAKKFGISQIPTPGGGCLLTEKEFGAKVKDLLTYKKTAGVSDFLLLKIGRHFRFGKNKIIIGRNEEENQELLKLKDKDDFVFEVIDFPSPITLLQGPKTKKAIETAAKLTTFYSDFKGERVEVEYGQQLEKKIKISSPKKEEVEKLRIVS